MVRYDDAQRYCPASPTAKLCAEKKHNKNIQEQQTKENMRNHQQVCGVLSEICEQH